MNTQTVPDWAEGFKTYHPTEPGPRPAKHRVGVTLYREGGEMMSPRRQPGNPTGKGGGQRGTVKTFTFASRRRLRQFLLCHDFKPGHRACGATMTVPGPVQDVQVYRDLWADWCRELAAWEWPMVWRAEVQQRGAMHWHCLIGLPRYANADVASAQADATSALAWCEAAGWNPDRIKAAWFRHLDRRFPMVEYPRDKKVYPWPGLCNEPASHGPLSWWPGAEEHCVQVESDEVGRGAWFRYLSDHASKLKLNQVGTDIGRHWGIVGRKGFYRLRGDFHELTNAQYSRFRRAYERLATPHVKADGSPFGKNLGRRCRRGRNGRAVCFTRPETLNKLLAYATAS